MNYNVLPCGLAGTWTTDRLWRLWGRVQGGLLADHRSKCWSNPDCYDSCTFDWRCCQSGLNQRRQIVRHLNPPSQLSSRTWLHRRPLPCVWNSSWLNLGNLKHPALEEESSSNYVPRFASSHLIDLAPNLLQFGFVAKCHETTAASSALGAN